MVPMEPWGAPLVPLGPSPFVPLDRHMHYFLSPFAPMERIPNRYDTFTFTLTLGLTLIEIAKSKLINHN